MRSGVQPTKRIRDRIVLGVLQPGEKLSVYSLADELGVSRVPLREAVRQLEAESHVDNVRRRGPHSGAIRGLARPRMWNADEPKAGPGRTSSVA
ncbi:GntR family transcriptional regulator [Rhodococcus opacus]|uniref:GntR family transcriptional regulator n=2 Tax=Rhodococcus TaxID=1827 RepID=UPI000B16D492|nr:GntR family transcriptional regulator [Rhodococcus opacus]